MKKKLLIIILASILTLTTLAGCGNSETETNSISEETANVIETIPTDASEIAETPHEHNFVEEIKKEATCLENGEITLTCECGEVETKTIKATGHLFENYISNDDATYEADGTETAKCNYCDEIDTRTAEGSMLSYTYEDMDATKYAKETVNVRSLPNSDSDKLGGLNQNDEVKVTGKCIETGWYRIEYSDSVAYVSDEYLVDSKIETKPASSSNNSGNSSLPTYATYAEVKAYAISLGYPIGSTINNGDGTANTYWINVVDSSNVCSWDYEYESRLSDLQASRRAVKETLGRETIQVETYPANYKPTKIAKCPDSGYYWIVSIGRG